MTDPGPSPTEPDLGRGLLTAAVTGTFDVGDSRPFLPHLEGATASTAGVRYPDPLLELVDQ